MHHWSEQFVQIMACRLCSSFRHGVINSHGSEYISTSRVGMILCSRWKGACYRRLMVSISKYCESTNCSHLKIRITSSYTFAHVTTAELSWQVQKCNMTWSPENQSKRIFHKISIMSSWNYSQELTHHVDLVIIDTYAHTVISLESGL